MSNWKTWQVIVAVLWVTAIGMGCHAAGYNIGQAEAERKFEYSQEELIHQLLRIDSLSRAIIDNNGLLDTDGSDTMSDYLKECCKLDSMVSGLPTPIE